MAYKYKGRPKSTNVEDRRKAPPSKSRPLSPTGRIEKLDDMLADMKVYPKKVRTPVGNLMKYGKKLRTYNDKGK